MPTELLKEFVDRECIITLINDSNVQIKGKVIGTEGYWIKIQEKNSNRIINGAMIRDIKTINEK